MASVRDLKVRELTVKKLTKLAKERGLKGYSNKNKSELLRLLEAQENSLDQPVPDINVPVLTPQPPSRVQRFKAPKPTYNVLVRGGGQRLSAKM